MGMKPRLTAKSSKPLTIGRRVELLVRDELAALLKASEFRKSHLTFRRQVGVVTQVIRFVPGTSSWGGKTPPKGYCQVLIGCGLSEFLLPSPSQSDCHLRFEIDSIVPMAERSWVVPMTRGPYRKERGVKLHRDIRSLLAVLDTLRDRASLVAAEHQGSPSIGRSQMVWAPPIEVSQHAPSLFEATNSLLVACAAVLGAPETELRDVRYRQGCIELDAIVGGQAVVCKGPPSAIQHLAAKIWRLVVAPDMIWKVQAHPEAPYPINPIEHSLFVGTLEAPMRALAGALAQQGHREQARLCLLRVIFPEDALGDPLGRDIFDSNPVRGMAVSGASSAGWLRKCLPFLSGGSPSERLGAAKTIAMNLGDVLADTSGKRLKDIVGDCRTANAPCLKDKTLAVRDLARQVEDRLDALLTRL